MPTVRTPPIVLAMSCMPKELLDAVRDSSGAQQAEADIVRLLKTLRLVPATVLPSEVDVRGLVVEAFDYMDREGFHRE